MLKSAVILGTVLSAGFVLAGCRGVATSKERGARADLKAVENNYRRDDQPPKLPELTNGADLNDFLHFAMLHNPQVEAAFYDWSASVERITIERSLPDPKLTFQAYIQDALTSLMPGLMLDFPGPGKLNARAAVASAESRARYFQFESSILQTAYAVKKSAFPLLFLDAQVRVNRQALALAEDLESLSRAQNEVGKATLQDLLRAQMEEERLRADISNLEHSRHSLMARFKAALGLRPDEANPPLPGLPEPVVPTMSDDELFAAALAHNPQLKAMEAEIRMAEASIALARKSKVPDFSAGLQAEVYTPPFYWPQASMTLPIWRDKIASEIRAAEAGKRAAQARLTSEQINLAVEFAETTHMAGESALQLDLLRNQLLPRARQSLEVARGAYRSGQTDFLNVIDAERTLLNFQLDEIAMQIQRETALAELSLLVAGVPPTEAPLLDTASASANSTP